MKELNYPFDAAKIIRNKRWIRDRLIDENSADTEIKIAILGGQTTEDIKLILELFLLNYGLSPVFYESEFNKWYEDGMFGNSALHAFEPDIIYICTSVRNIKNFPVLSDNSKIIDDKLNLAYAEYENIWYNITNTYKSIIIQNNFEYPYFRILGNKDVSDIHGRVNFITEINRKFYKYAQSHDNFYICDINYISSMYGLEKWANPYYWHMYKYAVAVPAIPYLSYNVANIIKSLYGKNKKAFNLDLDNTLWGGEVAECGPDNIEIGHETALGQSYLEFQEYLKLHKDLGVIFTVNSKNDEKNAVLGLLREDNILRKNDFVNIKANWDPKSVNLIKTAEELSLSPDSFVFIDDNPAEREIINLEVKNAGVPEIKDVGEYINIIDKSGFFESTILSYDDINKNEMYAANLERCKLRESFTNYEDYLKSLEMRSEIRTFEPKFISRIAQLTNKSNQFNLTTKRYSAADIEALADDPNYITLYGKLEDKFGDNGIVSVIIGKIDEEDSEKLHVNLWLMSCRVLKRNMEYAMMDELITAATAKGVKHIVGYYYPTLKNTMVKEFYAEQGFELVYTDDNGNTVWEYDIPKKYTNRQNVIAINTDLKD